MRYRTETIIPQYNELGLAKAVVGASLIAQLVKNLPAMQETWVQFLGWGDTLEKEMGEVSTFEQLTGQKGDNLSDNCNKIFHNNIIYKMFYKQEQKRLVMRCVSRRH